ncbi:hypothetical protein HanIR_Chr10g0467601 [Helianthus annuus]|nr:hypothetical protein HanIR_Chr10g0467601 [Helianthus annuus]
MCIFCQDREETAEHLFTGCMFSNFLWQAIANWRRFPVFYVCDLKGLTSVYKNLRLNSVTTNMVHALMIIGCWRIWKARNDRIFNNKETKIDEVFSDVKTYGYLWYNNRNRNTNCTWEDRCNCDC